MRLSSSDSPQWLAALARIVPRADDAPPPLLLARISLTHTHVSLRGGINTFVLLVLVSPPCSSSSHHTCSRLALHMFPHAVHTFFPIRCTHMAAAHMS